MRPRLNIGSLMSILLLSIAVASTGCAHYDYDIVQPPDLAQHVGENTDTVFSRNPLLYRLRSYDNHLVIQIQNPANQPITLLGGQSFVVDPNGQSHPLQTQTIAPQSFIKLILPPLRPETAPSGPVFGVGIGIAAAYPIGPALEAGYDLPIYDRPRYCAIYDDEGPYWSWGGETDIRLSLTFAAGNQPPFTQPFVFHRRKM